MHTLLRLSFVASTTIHTMSTSDNKASKDSKDAQAKESAASTATKQTEAQEAIEEDDEFEEFELNNWSKNEQDTEDSTQFKSSWDDDDGTDDKFTQQLRSNLA